MKMFLKRFTALASAAVMCLSMSGGVVSAQDEVDLCCETNLEPLSSEEIAQVCTILPVSENTRSTYTALPSIVDLSTSDYFPSIGYQYGGSCTSWATTYYQFTYEANKLNGIETNASNTYSPIWTHIFYSGSTGGGIALTEAYNVLKNQGALTYADCPYSDTSGVIEWPTDTAAMLNALKTKVVSASVQSLDTTRIKITSRNDTRLNVIKELLYNGKILAFASESPGNWAMKLTTTGEFAAYRASDSNGGHAMTIVGYDDTIKCDINGNGVIEASETGAFKVANSWGDWRNNGFVWVMYDALNVVSANSVSEANWQGSLASGTLSGTRVAIFDYQTNNNYNYLYYIDVANNPTYLVGMLTLSTNHRYDMELYVNRGLSYQDAEQQTVYKQTTRFVTDETMPYNGTLVVDYTTLDDSFPNSMSGFNWYVKLVNTSPDANITNVSYKITDNLGNVVRDFGTIATSISKNGGSIIDYEILNLQLGDVDYSETLTDEDAQIILQIAATFGEVSDLQMLLGDYNEDGYVNSRDAARLRMDLSETEAAEFDAAIAEMYCQLQSNARTMTADTEGLQYDKYAEMVTELYHEFVKGA